MPAPRRTVSLLAALLGTALLAAAAPEAHAAGRRATARPAQGPTPDLGAEAEPAPLRSRKPPATPPLPAAADPRAKQPVPKTSKPERDKNAAVKPATADKPADKGPPTNPPTSPPTSPAPPPSRPRAASQPASPPTSPSPPSPPSAASPPLARSAPAARAPARPPPRRLLRARPARGRRPAPARPRPRLAARVLLVRHGPLLRELGRHGRAGPQQVVDPAFLATDTVLRELPRRPHPARRRRQRPRRRPPRRARVQQGQQAARQPRPRPRRQPPAGRRPTLRAYVWTWLATTKTGGCHLGHLDLDFIEAAVADRSVAVEHGDDLVYRSLGDYALAARARLATLDPPASTPSWSASPPPARSTRSSAPPPTASSCAAPTGTPSTSACATRARPCAPPPPPPRSR
jgi:hypothetical protein